MESNTPAPTPKAPELGPVDESGHYKEVGVYLLFAVITCGFFNLYWNYIQMKSCNELLGRREFDFLMWFLLTLITCGLYHFYYQYKMADAIVELQENRKCRVFKDLPIISVIVTVFVPFVVDAIHQHEINKIVRPTS